MATRGNEWLATWLNTLRSTLADTVLETVTHEDDGEHEDYWMQAGSARVSENDADNLVDETFVSVSTALNNVLGLSIIDIPTVMLTSAFVSFTMRWYVLGLARGLGAPDDWLDSLGSSEWYTSAIAEAMDVLSSIEIGDDGTIRPIEGDGMQRIINPFGKEDE